MATVMNMPTCQAEDPDERIPCGGTPTVQVTDPDGYEHVLCRSCAAPLEPWICPHCGDDGFDENVKPDHRRSIAAWCEWLDDHALDCVPFLLTVTR